MPDHPQVDPSQTIAALRRELVALGTERDAALAREAALAEVLQIINSSPGDPAPVFDAILEKATQLCEAACGQIATYDGERFRWVAVHGDAPFVAEQLGRGPMPPSSGVTWRRIVGGEGVVNITDLKETDLYRAGHESARAGADIGGARSLLSVALRKEDVLRGILTVYRQEVRPFTDKQIALLQNFGAQAVIAMENARLLGETREALEQQTATSEVLQVINSSPGDLAPVFDAILEKAHVLCDAPLGSLVLRDGMLRAVATRGYLAQYDALARAGFPPTPPFKRLLTGEPFVHIHAVTSPASSEDDPMRRAAVEIAGIRTALFVPLRKDGTVLGYISAQRQEMRPFSDKEIALLQNFAAQAVIAMENARLIDETREALAQQTATAEVLGVINSSPGDLAPVFDAILEKAHTLCGAEYGSLHVAEGEAFRAVAVRGMPEAFADLIRHPFQPGLSHPVRKLIEGALFAAVVNSSESDDPIIRSALKLAGMRTGLFVPLRKDDVLLGYIVASRPEVRAFSDKQIALLENFAAQAVIAMENARLLTETREALAQQTATAEVLQVINSSPGDLAPVFDAMLEKATRLCEAAFGTLWTYDGERFKAVALRQVPKAYADFLSQAPLFPNPRSGLGRIASGDRFAHFSDVAADEAYQGEDLALHELVELGKARTTVAVPLRKDDKILGAITAYRQEVRPFSDKQIALLQNFAAQAVIAMENARLITETREALAQQTATAEVLQVINSSPGDLAPVFDAMLEKAMRLCQTEIGILTRLNGDAYQVVAARGPAAFIAYQLTQSFAPSPDTVTGRVALAGCPVQIPDVTADPGYRHFQSTDLGRVRTLLGVPLLRDGRVVGTINQARHRVEPFTDKQIALLQNFAGQAVIAMENARLLTETREALEQQTATAEVLQVINSSPGDLAPVFDAILEKAHSLCGAEYGVLLTYDGDRFWPAAMHGAAWARAETLREGFRPGFGFGNLVRGERLLHIHDMAEVAAQRPDDPLPRALVDNSGIRTQLAIPLRKDGRLLGIITANRPQVRPFSEKQIALLESFAAQAVIAMENARLLGELRQRTDDLQESLEYQTATSDLLKVISRSGGELDPVLQTLVETAARLCDAEQGMLHRRDGERYRLAASYGLPPEFVTFLQDRGTFAPRRGAIIGRAVIERRAVHIRDTTADPEFTVHEAITLGALRTGLAVPLLREGEPIGVIGLGRRRVEPFTLRQIALVTTFADQAVIAIENARLFNELRARTAELGRSVDELRVLNEVAQAVSSTLDLRTVLTTTLTRSVALAGADSGAVFRYSRAEREFRLVDGFGWSEEFSRKVADLRVGESETAMGEAAATRAPLQIPDLALRPSAPLRDAALAEGLRGVLIVPLVGAERILGAMVLQRREAGEFPAETVRLMQTLASQSVLAIQNARLFREIAEKSEQLALASEHKSQFLANMSHELRTPLNAILGYAELLVDGIYGALPEKAQDVLERVQNNGKHLLALINDVLDLAKIEAGQLALTLEDYSLPELVTTVAVATEPLASAKGLKFTAAVEDGMPRGHGDARRLAQVLLNLVGNAIKFTDAGEVEIRAVLEGSQFVLSVRDTGPGIADADQDRIFGEFQQIDNADTRKKGGTGLGLAISKRMVEMQGGMISVESALGRGSTFRVVLPVQVEPALEEAAE